MGRVRSNGLSGFSKKVEKALEEAGVGPGSRILIGCSGGPDSVSLLDSLSRLAPGLGLSLAVASFDHGLRAEAGAEVELVRSLAQDRGLDFFTARAVQDREPGRTDQAWARQARLAFLREAGERAGAHLIALAHTADDQAETVLMRLIRGSGVRGLAAMGVLDGHILRPLLRLRRAQVMDYLARRSLPFASDPSNANPKYLRVRVRQTLLPLLEDENPRLVESLVRLAANLGDDLKELEALAEAELARIGRPQEQAFALDLRAFGALPRARARRVVRLVYGRLKGDLLRLEAEHVEAVLALAQSGRGEAHLPAGLIALAGGDELLLAAREAPLLRPLKSLSIPGPGRYPLSTGETLEVEERAGDLAGAGPEVAYLDPERLSWPLAVRPVRPGDRIRPPGLKGSKKLSDILIDRKIPRHQRERLAVVAREAEVIWVAGVVLGRDWALAKPGPKALRIRLIRPGA